ncbi:MAG TPA: DNA replication/repair protein RecF [Candidatus Hydrogenedentes bacterium]|nr:DNA replication/repair protein RecF [Candidatus Hydrogenedentota bacterium]
MVLRELKTEGFRCLNLAQFAPGNGVNVIWGDNAQGKTSLLEAILYAATSKSHRTNQESDMVQHGQHGFRIHAAAQRIDRPVTVDATWWHGQKRFKVNGVAQNKVSGILGKMPVVFFSPEDVELVRGTAAVRRKFLDMEISQIEPAYLRALQQYRQVLKQRNELLKHTALEPDLLDAWDEQLVRYGRVIARSRRAFVDELRAAAAPAYQTIAESEDLAIAFAPDIPPDKDHLAALRETRERDRRYGLTHRGPHRDDFDLVISGKAARQFASQGQQRTAALALKLAELRLVRQRIAEYPILMLDDVLSELDPKRSRRLFQTIPEEVQCLLTATHLSPDAVPAGVTCSFYRITKGQLAQA